VPNVEFKGFKMRIDLIGVCKTKFIGVTAARWQGLPQGLLALLRVSLVLGCGCSLIWLSAVLRVIRNSERSSALGQPTPIFYPRLQGRKTKVEWMGVMVQFSSQGGSEQSGRCALSTSAHHHGRGRRRTRERGLQIGY